MVVQAVAWHGSETQTVKRQIINGRNKDEKKIHCDIQYLERKLNASIQHGVDTVDVTVLHEMSTGPECRRHRFWHAALRLRSSIRRHHPPQRAVLSQICCFGECKVVLFQILLDGAEPCDVGCLLQFAGGEANRNLLASALSSMSTICPNRASRRD